MNLDKSETFENLKTAFLREAAAYSEYEFYAMQAKTEGLQHVAQIFTQTANNEKAHAKIWFSLYHAISNTEDNLKNSAQLENFEWSKLYSQFEQTAIKEGFPDIAKLFNGVALIEKAHEERFSSLYKQVKNKTVFSAQSEDTVWICMNCGHVHVGKNPPSSCPVCSHPEGYFMISPNKN